HEADLFEHSQVLGNLRLGPAEGSHQVVHRTLPAGEDIQNLPSPGLGNGVEGIECGKGTWHGVSYIPIWEYVKCLYATIAASLRIVFQLRAVPRVPSFFSISVFVNFERPMPSG